jgi:DNA mismatch repair protein MutS
MLDIRVSLATLVDDRLRTLVVSLGNFESIQQLLTRALAEELPATLRDGGVIADGYDAQLDTLRNATTNAGHWLIDLEARERERTGISSLKVGYNRVHGYYIESNRAAAASVPPDYVRRQTLKNAERYITPELKAFEDDALTGQSRALARERALFDELLDAINEHLGAAARAHRRSPNSTFSRSMAERARRLNWSPGVQRRLDSTSTVVDIWWSNTCRVRRSSRTTCDSMRRDAC